MSEQEEVLGLIEDALSGDLSDNAEERAGALNEIAAMVRSGQILVVGSSPLNVANDLVAASDTSDWENCEVCAELEETCVVCASVTLGHAQVGETFTWDGTDEAFERLRTALPDPVNAYHFAADVIAISLFELPPLGDGTEERPVDDLLMVPLGWRIRIEGDSFAVLPPAQETDQ